MRIAGAVLTAAALVGWAASGRAAEPVAAPHDFPTDGAPALMAPANAIPASPVADTGIPGCGCSKHRVGLLEWLSYHPLHQTLPRECGSCCGGVWPPLYLYFMGHCSEHPCTACGGGCASCGWAGQAPSGADRRRFRQPLTGASLRAVR